MGCGLANPVTMTGYEWEVQESTSSSILVTGCLSWSSVYSTCWNPEEADSDASDGMHLSDVPFMVGWVGDKVMINSLYPFLPLAF